MRAYRRARRRRRTRFVLAAFLVVGVIALGAGIHSGSTGSTHQHASSRTHKSSHTRRRTRTRPTAPSANAPIPGYLLIADRGNNRILLVDNRKRIIWRYPGPSGSPVPFRFDDDAFFGPGYRSIISNQEEQDTLQIIRFPSGKLLWRYGHTNVKGSAPGYLNTPDDAYSLGNGFVSVADAYNCRVLFINARGRIVSQIGRTGACMHDPPQDLGSINGDTPLPGGGTLVSEINGSWIDAFSSSGRLLWDFQAPVSYPSDPQWIGHGHILLADYARPGHALIMDRSGHVLWRYGPASGPGMLDHPSLAMRIRPDLIAVTDDYRHRVVLIDVRTRRIVWQYGHTDRKGTAPGYLNTPDGLDFLPRADLPRALAR